jgi:hypothetical protein
MKGDDSHQPYEPQLLQCNTAHLSCERLRRSNWQEMAG